MEMEWTSGMVAISHPPPGPIAHAIAAIWQIPEQGGSVSRRRGAAVSQLRGPDSFKHQSREVLPVAADPGPGPVISSCSFELQ